MSIILFKSFNTMYAVKLEIIKLVNGILCFFTLNLIIIERKFKP